MKLRLCLYGLTTTAIIFSAIVDIDQFFPVPTLVKTQKAIAALDPRIISNNASSITVQINSKNSHGCGVIIKREGNTYTVLTAANVVGEKSGKYKITASDGKSYEAKDIKQLPDNIDLAVAKFVSNKNYKVAKIGNSDTIKSNDKVYVFGFPKATSTTKKSVEHFAPGKTTANASNTSKSLENGYALMYDNQTLAGMNGSPVLNENGDLIAIHADSNTAEEASENPNVAVLKTTRNFAVPINTFVQQSKTVGIDLRISLPATVATAPTGDEYYIQGGQKEIKGDLKGAIADYSKAIEVNPQYAEAYNDRGIARFKLGDKQGSIEDFSQALRMISIGTNARYNRAYAYFQLQNYQSAIADFNEVLRINPNNADSYIYRGIARLELKDKQGGKADLQKAAELFKQQGRMEAYQKTLVMMRELQKYRLID
ncbi:tetratricopeptide repeat-containing S1 family peptidase [Fischerella sp. PCC 9605]|uniref:tetratricopeptide repeat-containing S1 family peptidase n=1 Tax=Fischerella sp. PCC 9605 TaxID=1173024 RepID=UPI0004AD6016|nr:tetratricopeptide repeat-containing serine protease family protein [Fischerella sp. PCC 9605]